MIFLHQIFFLNEATLQNKYEARHRINESSSLTNVTIITMQLFYVVHNYIFIRKKKKNFTYSKSLHRNKKLDHFQQPNEGL